MNKLSLLAIIWGSISAQSASADDTITNQWGITSCGVQMSVKLKDSVEVIKKNQTVNLLVSIKNVSTNRVFVISPMLRPPIYFSVTSPSGKDLSTKLAVPPNDVAFSRTRGDLDPNDTVEFHFNLSSMCNLSETGTYKISANGKINGNCDVASNPLNLFAPLPLTNVVDNVRRNGR